MLNFVKFSEEIALRKDPHARLKTVSNETKEILQELEKEYKAPEAKETKKEVKILILKIFLCRNAKIAMQQSSLRMCAL